MTILVHGWQYDPDQDASSSPLLTVYSATINPLLSWIPLAGERVICLSYATSAGAGLYSASGWQNEYQYGVFEQAPDAGAMLAYVLLLLAERHIEVRILAHSLGTRTVGQALGCLPVGEASNVSRIVLMAGAEFCVDAYANFIRHGIDIVNLCSSLDRVLLVGGSKACHPFRRNNSAEAATIGVTGLGDYEHWIDLQLNRTPLQRFLGYGEAPSGQRYAVTGIGIDGQPHVHGSLGHWCCYTETGNRDLVRDLLHHPAMTVDALKRSGIPSGTLDPMWGRFTGMAVPPTPGTTDERRDFINNSIGQLNG